MTKEVERAVTLARARRKSFMAKLESGKKSILEKVFEKKCARR